MRNSVVHHSSWSGWWYTYPSEKYEFVSWDYDIPNIWKVMKFMFQTTNQYTQYTMFDLNGGIKIPNMDLRDHHRFVLWCHE